MSVGRGVSNAFQRLARNQKTWASVVLLVLLLAGCSPSSSDEFRIAVVVDQSGQHQAIGKAVLLGARFAAAQLDTQIKIVPFDDESSEKVAREIAQRIVADGKFLAVIGHASSGMTSVGQEFYGRAGIPFLLPVATKPAITARAADEGRKNILRLVPTHDLQATTIVEYARRLGAKRALVINDDTDYGQDLGQNLEKAFENSQIRVPVRSEIAPVSKTKSTDFSNVIANYERFTKQQKIDIIVFAGYYTEGAYIVKQIREAAIPVPIVLTDGCFQKEVFDILGAEDYDSVFISFIAPDWKSVPAAKPLVLAIQKEYNDDVDPSYAPFAADAVQILWRAIQANRKSLSAHAILSTLRDKDFEYKGIAGTYRFNDIGDWSSGANYIYSVDAKARRFIQVGIGTSN